jgi:hypothetical protein
MTAPATVTADQITRTAPVVLTRDLEILLTLNEAPGMPFTVVAQTPLQAEPYWTDAPAVFVGADQVRAALAADLPARRMIVVTNDMPADLDAVAKLATDHGGNHYRADVVRVDLLPHVLGDLLAQ